MSALQLRRQLGIARYETAWGMLHKLRRAMVRPDRAPLHTEVEVRGRGSGRIRLQVVPDASARSLSAFVRANVEPGTVVRTDGWPGYAPLASMSYRHRPRTRGNDPRRAAKLWPRVHRVLGNLQTSLRGTHHGVGKHLQVYLDEFTFWFNRRRTPPAAFQTLLGLGTRRGPTT